MPIFRVWLLRQSVMKAKGKLTHDGCFWSEAPTRRRFISDDIDVMLEAGVRDKTASLVFDGDIIRLFDDEAIVRLVTKRHGAYGYVCNPHAPPAMRTFVAFASNNNLEIDNRGISLRIEIIGNKYQTPELLGLTLVN